MKSNLIAVLGVICVCVMFCFAFMAGKNYSRSRRASAANPASAPAVASQPAGHDVTVSEDQQSFILDNGLVTAKVSKKSGDLLSLKYKNLEMLDNADQHQPAYWSHNAAQGEPIIPRVTIDPKSNSGERGEVSVKGISGGKRMGSGPGGSVVSDIEIRYSLGRNDSGIYTYSIFTHPTNYPGTSFGEARFCAKLNDNVFDWMTVDSNRNMEMISTYDWNHGTQMNMKETRLMNSGIYKGTVEHKYDYAANQFDVRAWGWSSSKDNVGIWFINPSTEYLSGGPTKVELSAHRDATFNTNALNAPAPPCLLNYWRGSHYGGSICNVAATDDWTKVIGPFFIYCNSGDSHDALWKDALQHVQVEASAWPYDWVEGVDYPHKAERATVSGTIVFHDPQAPGLIISNLLVGLTAPDYAPASVSRGFGGGRRFGRGNFGGGFGGGGGSGFGLAGGGEDEASTTNQNNSFAGRTNNFNSYAQFGEGATNRFARFGTNNFRGRFPFGFGFGLPRIVDWQIDAKNYEFWVRADANGNFTIPNVRPGQYTLHAIADGVLGDFAVSNVTVTAGQNLQLSDLNWQPVRYGKQLWDIGIPNRNAGEFLKGDDYYHWGWYLQYPKLFPNDVNYIIGKSDFHKDWFFEQVPHNEDPDNANGLGQGRSTTWSITFDLPEVPSGKVTLRMAICGVGTRELSVSVNDQPAGTVTGLLYNATINRDGVGGSWGEHDVAFDASLMHAGTNVIKLTIPGGGLTSGIMYDYLRLELNSSASLASAKQ
ncbi:MAG TPA: polysaccharide lyase family protein [Pseudomonadales bacterium]|nr:polysaccharide lyase family protein [Pseudomonadales bacterium]